MTDDLLRIKALEQALAAKRDLIKSLENNSSEQKNQIKMLQGLNAEYQRQIECSKNEQAATMRSVKGRVAAKGSMAGGVVTVRKQGRNSIFAQPLATKHESWHQVIGWTDAVSER